jgi:hypothetical protein
VWPLDQFKDCVSKKYQKCHKGTDRWKRMSLEDFMSCQHNLAINRQTKFLVYNNEDFPECAIMSKNKSVQFEMLERAKKTVNSLVYFAISEYQNYSQLLFEKSVGRDVFKYNAEAQDFRLLNSTVGHSYKASLNSSIISRIQQMNHLDVQLYDYALKVFFARLRYFNII